MNKYLALTACLSVLAACDQTSEKPTSNTAGSEENTLAITEQLAACPPPPVAGHGTFSGSASHPIPTVYGKVSVLESKGPPMEFTTTEREVVLSGVHYEGTVADTHVVPTAGNIEELRIDGEIVDMESGDISTGCLTTAKFGKVLILFENPMMSEAVTVVMTEVQIKKLD